MALFLDHVNVVLQKLRQDPITALSTDTTTEAYRAQIAVNRAIARVWNHKQWAFKKRTDTLATVSGTMNYEMPKSAGEPYSVLSTGSTKKLRPIPKHHFDLRFADPTSSGDPEMYVLSDMLGVNEQPSSASVITIVSSDASDTTQAVLIKGLVSGQEDYEQVTLNGTTSASTTKSFSSIISVTKSAATAGRVTLTSNGGAVTNLVLAPQENTIRLRKVSLYPIPASVLTVTFHNFANPPYLTHRYEDSQIPARWDYIVDQWAYALALQAKGQDQAMEFKLQYEVAKIFLEEDMSTEEKISSEEPVMPLKAGDFGDSQWAHRLPGYGYTE
jgi:hypothetical protein